jgi:glutaredoxin
MSQIHATIYRLPKCPSGIKAIELLEKHHIPITDCILESPEAVANFKAQYQVSTTPQVFINGERIGGYEKLREYLQLSTEPEYSYVPVMAVFGTAGLVTLATASGFMGMMGFSLAMLASLKLMDIESFAESYANYDLVTQRYKPYGKIYPFAELAIALGFLSGVASGVVGIASMLIGIVGGISVFKAVYIDKKSLNCACIGGNSKAPLQIVSFSENLIMAVMGAYLSATTVTGAVPTKPVGEILQPQVQISQVKSHTVP